MKKIFLYCISITLLCSCQKMSIERNRGELEVVVSEKYIEGSKSILLSDGRFIVYTPATESQDSYFFYADSLDVNTSQLSEGASVSAYCDSLFRPVYMLLGDETLLFKDYTENTCVLTVLSDAIKERTFQIKFDAACNGKYETKASSSGKTFLGGASNTLSVIDAVTGYVSEGRIGLIKSLAKIFLPKYLPEPLEEVTNFTVSIAEVAFANSKLGIAGAVISSLQIQKEAARLSTRHYIGDCTPYIFVDKAENGSVTVAYNVENFSISTKLNPSYLIKYWELGNNGRKTSSVKWLRAAEGTEKISGLYPGNWKFQMLVFPEIYNDHPFLASFYGFESNVASFMVPIADIKSVEQTWIEPWDDNVQASFKIQIETYSETVLNLNENFGIRVVQDGKEEFYPARDNGSVTEFDITLNIPNRYFKKDKGRDYMIYDGPDITFNTYFTLNGYQQNGITHTCEISYSTESHIHAIDLGLSVKWACCNVGATKPAEYGGYYAWGETEEKSVYTEVTYKYAHGIDENGDGWYEKDWSYDNIGSDISGTQYDVAHVIWGGSWRMPTQAEIQELFTNCSSEWITLNGLNGVKFTSIKNGNSIFLPAAGYRNDDNLSYNGFLGYYWSSSLHTNAWYYADYLYFYSNDVLMNYDKSRRYYGHSVRPVSE